MASLPSHADGRGCHAAAVAGAGTATARPACAGLLGRGHPARSRRSAGVGRGPSGPRRGPQPRQPLTMCGDRSGSCSWNSTRAATHPASAARPAASLRSPQPLLVARRARLDLEGASAMASAADRALRPGPCPRARARSSRVGPGRSRRGPQSRFAPKGDASGTTPGDRLPNKARAGLAGIAAVLPMMDDGCWHRRQRAPSGVILAMREEMSGSTLKR